MNFKHSGDMGDIVFSLPVIKELGGGILYLDPEGGEQEPLVAWNNYNKTKLDEKSIDNLKPILEAQDYIKEVKLWEPSVKIDYNLDKFRQHVKFNNLTASHLDAFGLLDKMETWTHTPWLEIKPKSLPEGKTTILARSCRVHSNYSFWEQLDDAIIDASVFVSHPKEFEYFLYTFPRYIGRIERLNTPALADLASYICACDLFIGNQGLPHALAEGMKKKIVNEVYRVYPSCLFKRKNVTYV